MQENLLKTFWRHKMKYEKWKCSYCIGWWFFGLLKYDLYINEDDYWSIWVINLWLFSFGLHAPVGLFK